MRRLSLILSVAPLMAQSHPSWWGFASPDATALVGIRWEVLASSVFAPPLEAEFSGNLSFPDLPLLRESRQILISSPATIAMFYGSFPAATLQAQASAKGLKPSAYRGVPLWIAPGKTLSVAEISEQVLAVGLRKTLEAAIDRNQAETGTSRKYSPLLARGARFASNKDLWVVATKLPDPLASLFVPLEAEARGFEGGVSLRDGVELDASLDAGSEDSAAVIAENLRHALPELPQIAQSMKVVAEADHVLLTLEVNRAQLAAGMKGAEAPPAAAPATNSAAPRAPAAAVAAAPDTKIVPRIASPAPEPAGPQVIRIFGLDDGVREIVLPGKPEKQD